MNRRTAALLFGFGSLVVLVYADPLFAPRAFGGRDYPAYNMPMEKAVYDAYRRGRLPVWQADVSGGRPLLPNPNAGALYPLRLVVSRLRFPVAMKVFPVFHWILAGSGLLLLLRRLGGSAAASWVGAATYAFSGVAVSEVFYPHIQAGMALLPWIVWVIARPSSAPKQIFCLACLFALDLLAGDIFTNVLALFCVLLWVVLEEERPHQRILFGRIFLALSFAALAAAPQLVATALWLPETNRGVLGMNIEESFFFSLSPWRLIEFVVPYAFGNTWALDDEATWGQALYHGKTLGLFSTLYLGALPILGALMRWPAAESRRAVRFARVLLVAGVAMAALPSLTPAAWLSWHSPFALRNPEKFAVGIAFALALLAGLTFDRIRAGFRNRWGLLAGGLLAALAAGVSLWPALSAHAAVALIGGGPEKAMLASRQLPAAIAEGGLLWMITLVGLELLRRPHRAYVIWAAGLLTAVPLVVSARIAQTFREEEVFAPTAFARTLDRLDPARLYRVLGESVYRDVSDLDAMCRGSDPSYTQYARASWAQHTHALWGRGSVFNYDFDSGDLSRMESLRRVARYLVGTEAGTSLFANLSLRWGIRFRDQPALPGYRRFGGDLLQDWDVNRAARPAVRLLETWRETTGAVEALRALPTAPGEILLETGKTQPGGARPGRVQVLENTPERLRLETAAEDPGWLFVTRGYWTYRTVRIDGQEVETVPAELALAAVAVASGVHHVEWTEELPGGRFSLLGPPLFLCILVAILWRVRRGRRLPIIIR